MQKLELDESEIEAQMIVEHHEPHDHIVDLTDTVRDLEDKLERALEKIKTLCDELAKYEDIPF